MLMRGLIILRKSDSMKKINDKISSVKQFTEVAGQSVGQFTTKTVDVATNKFNEFGQNIREKNVDIIAIVNEKPKQLLNSVGQFTTKTVDTNFSRKTVDITAIVNEKPKQLLHEVVYETRYETREMAQCFLNLTKEKLENFRIKNIEWFGRGTVVGNFTSAAPLLLKDLPTVAETLANRTGGGTPEKLFDLIPMGVKFSEESILNFLKNHHVSHRISIKNDPTKAGNPNNVIFENPQINLARGPENMTPPEFQNAQLENLKIGIVSSGEAVLGSVARGALVAAVLELPITCIENVLHVRNNLKSVKEGVIDAAIDVGKIAFVGGAVAGVLTGLSLLGVTMETVAIPLIIVGGILYVWSATDRIWKALDDNTKEKLLNYKPIPFLASAT